MIQPGMMFGGEGPVMQGTWYNPQTGDAFTVRDSFFEDNQYVVTTTDGRYLQYNQLQNYIQTDMKLDELKRIDVKKEEQVPTEILNMIDTEPADNSKIQTDDYFGIIPEDMELMTGNSLGNIYATPTQHNQPTGYTTQPAQNLNTTIIEKALKNTSKPTFSITVNWPDYPSKEIEMLKDIMDIPTTEIVDWYLDNIQLDEFIMAFKAAIDDKISFGNEYKQVEVKVIKLEESAKVPEMTKDEVKEEKNTEKKTKEEKKSKRAPKAAKK